jgi:hypothetical protein
MPRKRRFYRQRMPRRTERTNRVSGRALRPAAAVHGLKARADPPQPACPRRGMIPTQAFDRTRENIFFLNAPPVDGET